jgi:hypothetical protein
VLAAAVLVASADAQFSIQRLRVPPAVNDECNLCVSFASDALDELLQLILNAGVLDGCNDLCEKLAQKTGRKTLGAVCDILCSIEGLKAFIALVNKVDLDPIYFCQELKECPINDNADARVIGFSSVPAKGPRGTTFMLELEYVSVNGTSTGQLGIDIQTVDGLPLGQGFFMEAKPAGTYNLTLSLEAKVDPSCDPMQQPCEEWLPGQYTATMVLCNGECGSKHPHSKTLFQASTQFELTA